MNEKGCLYICMSMKHVKLLLLVLLFPFQNLFAGNIDSLIIDNIKRFVFKEIGVELEGNFYTEMKSSDDPYYYLYVSMSDRIAVPWEFLKAYQYCESKEAAYQKAYDNANKGYVTFVYYGRANSGTELTKTLLSYRKESLCFTIFHELMHNYKKQMNLDIPYDFEEALCDVVGNYGAMKYAKEMQITDFNITKKQTKLNEDIYECMNYYISKINKEHKHIPELNLKCGKEVKKLLLKGDSFQKDRFDFEVNNAYLLKNSYYCKNYFLLKKVFLKQKSIRDFLELIKTMPDNSIDCIKYLEASLAKKG